MQGVFVLLFVCTNLLFLGKSFADSTASTNCVLAPSECQKYGYEMARLPNFNGDMETEPARRAMWTYERLYQDLSPQCNSELKMLLCLAYFPLCLDSNLAPAGPCQSFCTAVTDKCDTFKHGLGHPLTVTLTCKHLPQSSTYNRPCANSTAEVTRLLNEYQHKPATTTVQPVEPVGPAASADVATGERQTPSGTSRPITDAVPSIIVLVIAMRNVIRSV